MIHNSFRDVRVTKSDSKMDELKETHNIHCEGLIFQ